MIGLMIGRGSLIIGLIIQDGIHDWSGLVIGQACIFRTAFMEPCRPLLQKPCTRRLLHLSRAYV